MKQQEALKLQKGMVVTATSDKDILKTLGIPAEYAGANALVYQVDAPNDKVYVIFAGANGHWVKPADITLQPGTKLAKREKPTKFGKTDIERIRIEGGNKSLKSAMDERLNAARGHLQNAGSLEKHNKEMALAREQVRQVNLLFRAIKKV